MQAPRSGRAFGPDRYPEPRQRADPGYGAWRVWARPGQSGAGGWAQGAGPAGVGAIEGRGIRPGRELVRRVPLPRWALPAAAQGPAGGGLQPAPDLASGTVRTSGLPCSGRTDDPEPYLSRVKNAAPPLCGFRASLHPYPPFGTCSVSDRLRGTFSL